MQMRGLTMQSWVIWRRILVITFTDTFPKLLYFC
uniref:Uncharacterized protein n=1 Tax=Rhizophora mucronata TaxID=61149 RepID=A0A2P2JP02_RHIMU